MTNAPLTKIDLHTHLLPETWPDLRERYGYGGWVRLEHYKPCCARMMIDDTSFREIGHNCWDPAPRLDDCNRTGVRVQVLSTAHDGTFATKSGTTMAAPHVAGVAAVMAAVRADLPAADLRAALLQNALAGALPVGSGYLYALGSVLSVASAANLAQGQPPDVRILKAQRSGIGRRATTQVAVRRRVSQRNPTRGRMTTS